MFLTSTIPTPYESIKGFSHKKISPRAYRTRLPRGKNPRLCKPFAPAQRDFSLVNALILDKFNVCWARYFTKVYKNFKVYFAGHFWRNDHVFGWGE
jgi:hypothetical protein